MLYKNYKITVFIPCYNEEKGIKKVLSIIPKFVDEILVIDNASTDKTAEVATSCGARVIKNETNLGYGGSYLKGLPLAEGDIIVTCDGDGTYPIQDCQSMLDVLIDENLDFVSGCRFPLKNKKNMRKRNKIGNWGLTFLVNLFFGLKLKDGQSGMWAFNKDILSKVTLKARSMAFSNEIKIEIFKNKDIKAKEFHINYRERIGESKLYPILDGIKMLIFLTKKKFFDRR